MMQPRNLWLLLLVGLLLGLAWWLVSQSPKRFSWRHSYRADSQQPYGAYALRHLFDTYPPGGEVVDIRDSFAGVLPGTGVGANYVFVGESIFLTPSNHQQLLDFVAAGNVAFLAVADPANLFDIFPENLAQCAHEGGETEPGWSRDSIWETNFLDKNIQLPDPARLVYHEQGQPAFTDWYFLPEAFFCEDPAGASPLGTVGPQRYNFVHIPHGQGHFYWHSQPLLFTNFFVVQPQGRAYAEGALSYLAEGTIYWDEYSRLPAMQPDPPYGGPHLQADTALRYVLSQPPLAWAWYVLAALGFLYLLFGAKRRQEVIPMLEPRTNDSLAFIHTIGWLHLHRSSHYQLATQAMKLFRGFVLERYGLALRDDANDYAQRLATRSAVDEQLVRSILQMYAGFARHERTDEDSLHFFNQRLEQFYQQAK